MSMSSTLFPKCRYRSHFGSRYKLGCCGHAGLFIPSKIAALATLRAQVTLDIVSTIDQTMWPTLHMPTHMHGMPKIIANDSCGVRTHALSEWRLEPPP